MPHIRHINDVDVTRIDLDCVAVAHADLALDGLKVFPCDVFAPAPVGLYQGAIHRQAAHAVAFVEYLHQEFETDPHGKARLCCPVWRPLMARDFGQRSWPVGCLPLHLAAQFAVHAISCCIESRLRTHPTRRSNRRRSLSSIHPLPSGLRELVLQSLISAAYRASNDMASRIVVSLGVVTGLPLAL